MLNRVFPGRDWGTVPPEEAGFDGGKLEEARGWLDGHIGDGVYRLVVVRGGRVAVEWNHDVDRDRRFPIASAAKSIYGNVLGIVAAEGGIPSPDAGVIGYYPEMMDVPEGEGPKEGRYAFAKDRGITFRQLISNTSGYMKPGEEPGRVFHYQTYGMNILTHALAKVYGLYDVRDPEGSPGFGRLIEEKVAEPIGATWTYSLGNFRLHEKARIPIFGYYCQVHSHALDLARLGWLWCNWGRWGEEQVVPEDWMRASVQVNPDVRTHSPEEEWKYGYGIWTNAEGRLWPKLSHSGFTASGAGGHYLSVFPDRDLVIVQNPGPYRQDAMGSPARGNPELLGMLLDALDG